MSYSPATATNCSMSWCPAGPEVPAELQDKLQGAAFAIWTTTPWTVPANAAVAVNADLQYVLVEAEVSHRWHTLAHRMQGSVFQGGCLPVVAV